MPKNPGHLPPECEIYNEDGQLIGHRRVHVRLFNGWSSKAAGTGSWPSHGGRPVPTDWTIRRGTPHPFDIESYEVAE